MGPPPHPTGEALSGEVYTMLLAENRRLQEELARPPHPSPPTPRPPALLVRLGRGAQGRDGGAEPWHPKKQRQGVPRHAGGITPVASPAPWGDSHPCGLLPIASRGWEGGR